MKTKRSVFFLLLFAFSTFSKVTAQEGEVDKSTFLLFDELIGIENTGIFNGIEHIETYRVINEKHQFFQNFNYLTGLVVYEGQPYYDVELKYNVYDDLLLVQLSRNVGKSRFRLYNEKLDGFEVAGHDFINLKGAEIDPSRKGIYELLFQKEELMLLKKHLKKMKKILSGDVLRHEFENAKPKFFFLHGGDIQELNSDNLFDAFPDLKEEIGDFYRENRKLRRSNPDEFSIKLFNRIASLTIPK